jgi:hypothetical protein
VAIVGPQVPVQPILIQQGAKFDLLIQFLDGEGNPYPIGSGTLVGQIRQWKDSPDVEANFTFTAVDANESLYRMKLTAVQTASIPAGVTPEEAASQHVYDVFVVFTTADKDRLLEGPVTVNRRVTQ